MKYDGQICSQLSVCSICQLGGGFVFTVDPKCFELRKRKDSVHLLTCVTCERDVCVCVLFREIGQLTEAEALKGSSITVCSSAYEACDQSHAVVVCTEWDEFKVRQHKYSRTVTLQKVDRS